MLRQSIAIGSAMLALTGASAVIAQTADDTDFQYREIQQARIDMDQARRQLEEAARTIAAQYQRVLPDAESRNLFVRNMPFLVSQAQIGVSITDADNGALVTAVSPGSGAEAAGIRVGDVIQSIDGIDVSAADGDPSAGVAARLREIEPGDSVTLVIVRAGQSMAFDVETNQGPPWLTSFSGPGGNGISVFAAPDAPPGQVFNIELLEDGSGPAVKLYRSLGFAASPWGDMELVSMSEQLGRYFETTEGLLVIRAPEDEAIDIQDGDVILSISGRTPNSPEHAIRILSSFESGETIEFSLMRDGRRRSVEYAIPEQNSRIRAAPVPD